MVFMVIISSVLLAVCTSLKPIYLQNAIDTVDAGADGALTMFRRCILWEWMPFLRPMIWIRYSRTRRAICPAESDKSWRWPGC